MHAQLMSNAALKQSSNNNASVKNNVGQYFTSLVVFNRKEETSFIIDWFWEPLHLCVFGPRMKKFPKILCCISIQSIRSNNVG